MRARETIIPVFVPHLGCPNDCVFCNQRRISGTQTPATAEDVRRAMEEGLDRIRTAYGAASFSETVPAISETEHRGISTCGQRATVQKAGEAEFTEAVCSQDTAQRRTDTAQSPKIQLAFYGGSFTAIPVTEQESLLGVAREYLRSGVIHSVRLSTRPDAIDAAVLERLKRYGVETIEIGAQSMDNEVLRRAGRGHTAEDVESAARQIKAAGFRLILQMMTGLPGDTIERSIRTAEKLIALRPDGVRIYPTVIVRDTALYDLWITGKYREHTVEDAVEYCAKLLPLFQNAGIPVIRLGLNPTDELSSGAAAGGAYHPALGELVKSRILREKAEAVLMEYRFPIQGSSVILGTTPSLISQLTGQHRCNVSYLKDRFGLAELKIKAVTDHTDTACSRNIADHIDGTNITDISDAADINDVADVMAMASHEFTAMKADNDTDTGNSCVCGRVNAGIGQGFPEIRLIVVEKKS